jgi:hypothetical protein
MKKAGLFLVGAGMVMAILASAGYYSMSDAVHAGPVVGLTRKQDIIAWSPMIGIAVLVAGAGILYFGWKRPSGQ